MLKLTFNYSKLDEMEQSGAIYKINGKQQDPLTILKDNGVNYVRLRFWVDPGKQNLPKA
ncbi:Arabinogalactan endo-beta-1,4-galactanase [Streptococcus infantarius subsp. infantarius]|nr:Arabinogalactan endo-beta-1,4-galactanase [Streptococcus infantarius subsp. infantarius]